MRNINCPYCGQRAELKDTEIIYGRSYGNAWICRNYPKCDAYVGVHRRDNNPLGSLANAELRTLREECHAKFDQLWSGGRMNRNEAYELLMKIMKLNKKKSHIAKFDKEKCNKLLSYFFDEETKNEKGGEIKWII